MLESKKKVFWEALLITLVIFILGFFLGILFENSQASVIETYYSNSEIFMSDALASINLFDLNLLDCSDLQENNRILADKVYQESLLLEDYESRGKITEGMKIMHRKYDLLRTFLWMNDIKINQRCERVSNSLVYLYKYQDSSLEEKASQNVWSKVLLELKEEEGQDLILIPIAVDTNISSLEAMVSKYNLTSYPVAIINNNLVIDSITNVEDLKKILEENN